MDPYGSEPIVFPQTTIDEAVRLCTEIYRSDIRGIIQVKCEMICTKLRNAKTARPMWQIYTIFNNYRKHFSDYETLNLITHLLNLLESSDAGDYIKKELEEYTNLTSQHEATITAICGEIGKILCIE